MVKNYKLLAFLLFMFAITACTSKVLAYGKYKYKGMNSGKIVTFNTIKKTIDNGHRVFFFEFCNSPLYIVCFFGDITIAIPKNNLKVNSEWNVAGSTFTVKKITQEDDKQNYEIVVNPHKGKKMHLFYNKDNGIWGITLIDSEIFKSMKNCGLGCKKEVVNNRGRNTDFAKKGTEGSVPHKNRVREQYFLIYQINPSILFNT